jgi:threonine aldolase
MSGMVVDLRSDTLTMPSPEMREVMAKAPVGDDVYGEDPSIRALEERAAELTGKRAAVFVASGTMGNLLGILALARSGQEIIVDVESHVFNAEGGGAAAIGGIQIRPLTSEAGVMAASDVEAAIRRTDDYHQPLTRAICLENTNNHAGGVCWPLEDLKAVRDVADRHGLSIHLDGARLFNAAIALGVPATAITAYADTVTFCVSKGLAAPVGSVLCGSPEAIDTARRWRKMVGGGWREAGSLAAAGSYALEHNIERLADDHRNARTLAEGLAELPGIEVDLDRVQTNLVFLELTRQPAGTFLEACAKEGVLGGGGGSRVRFVTHYGIDSNDIQHTLKVCATALNGA